ncbi:MAG TPA: aminoacyl-tRNA hydrolase [Bacteroidia bacterium]|nr:aminoacyl-tRNA hydrolase [Bacteroidia bacterium]
MKYLIVGLGNAGEEYSETRHNIGFKIADALADSAKAFFISGRLAHICEFRFKGRIVTLIKPTTYMNLSGKAVNYWLQQEKIPMENLFVITDDIALPFGTIRIRAKGSDGGHNGLTSVIETLNTTVFARLRFGVGNEFNKGGQVDYVLGKWSEEEKKVLNERIEKSVEAVKSFISIGLGRTMNAFNNK